MKYLLSITVLSFCFLMACNNSPDRPEPMLDPGYEPTQPATSTPITPATTTTSGSSVFHYICPNNCGGGDAAGTCPTCGTAYVHNQAFHNQTPATPATPTPGNTANSNTITPPTQTPEPPQNAAGVWHYTCPSGCEGGAGSAVACANCGTTLQHNTLYHQ